MARLIQIDHWRELITDFSNPVEWTFYKSQQHLRYNHRMITSVCLTSLVYSQYVCERTCPNSLDLIFSKPAGNASNEHSIKPRKILDWDFFKSHWRISFWLAGCLGQSDQRLLRNKNNCKHSVLQSCMFLEIFWQMYILSLSYFQCGFTKLYGLYSFCIRFDVRLHFYICTSLSQVTWPLRFTITWLLKILFDHVMVGSHDICNQKDYLIKHKLSSKVA